jgi:hypothetical protein
MSWFYDLTGFREENASQIHKLISLDKESFSLTSSVNDRTMVYGRLETPSLGELRGDLRRGDVSTQRMKVSSVRAHVQDLHSDSVNAGAFFQVASQFNLLEMMDYSVTPDRGITDYERDRTQGPACATSAGAGTIYRNYFAHVNGRVGQTADNQIDTAADLAAALSDGGTRPWQMTNGYALATESGLDFISQKLRNCSEQERDELRQLLRIGVQSDTEVTLRNCGHKVTQAFCSGLPVNYCDHPVELWEDAARLVLEASYEATICAAIGNSQRTGNTKVFLTFIGGGVFGNKLEWITEAIDRSLSLYKHWPLDVVLVNVRPPRQLIEDLVKKYS